MFSDTKACGLVPAEFKQAFVDKGGALGHGNLGGAHVERVACNLHWLNPVDGSGQAHLFMQYGVGTIVGGDNDIL